MHTNIVYEYLINEKGLLKLSSFVKGTFFLMVVIFISKLLGFVYRMQFMRIGGEEAVGVYMTAYPAFIFFLSVIQLGIPIAVAKIVAELHARKRSHIIPSVMKTSIVWTGISTIIFIPIFILFIPFLSTNLLHNSDARLTLYIALAAVPIAVGSGLIRGYLQGLAQITPTAWSQMLEQVIRILCMSLLLPYAANLGESTFTAAAAMGITLLAELCAFLYLYVHYRISKKRFTTKQADLSYYKSGPILRVALPSAGSRLFGTFTWFLEPIVFLKALSMAGIAAASATSLYGVISGVLIPLLLFPSFVPNALSIVLIPAVSDAIARNHSTLLRERVNMSLRLSSLLGCMAAAFFYLHGDELSLRLFHLEDNRGYMQMLAPVFYFYYIQAPLHSILQAVGEARAAMMNSIYGGLGKLFVMFVLASQPALAEKGAVLAIGFGVLMTSFLHVATVRQHKKLHAGFRMFVVPYFIFILVCVFQVYVGPMLHLTFEASCALTILLLIVMLLLTKQFKLKDIAYLRTLIFRK